jgi:hypothetical protein
MAPLKCNGKNIYDKKGAVSMKNHRWETNHVALRIYYCQDCRFWHLTSSNPFREDFTYGKIKNVANFAKRYKGKMW